jgi:MFS family permease
MLDLSLFDDRAFAFGSATAVINYIGGYPVVLLMPFYLIQGRGMSATTAGLLLGVQTLVMAVAAPIAGRLSDRVGGRRLIVGGMLALAAGVGCLGLLGASTPLPLVAGALFLVGLGTGTFISPNTSAVLGAAPPHRRGIASGVLAEARNVGMVLGVGLAGAVFTTTLGGVLPGPHPVLFRALSSAFLVSAAVSLAGAGVAFLGGRSRRTADQT